MPRLGWIASIPLATEDVVVLHGSAVELAEDWIVEGVWDAPFAEGAFHRSEAFFGSGLRIDGGAVLACASTALVDRLLYYVHEDHVVVSNSLLVMLAQCGARPDIQHDYSADFSASLRGIHQQPQPFRIDHPFVDEFKQLVHGNLVVSGGRISIALRSSVHRLESYERYIGQLRAALARIKLNYEDPARRVPLKAYTTSSSGYDSPAVSCLARELGVVECFTTDSSVDTRLEDGASIAAAIGLVPCVLRPPGPTTTRDEAYYIASSIAGSELIFHDMTRRFEGSGAVGVLFTGYHGDKVWDVRTSGRYLADDILRGDTSGSHLMEIRLKSGFINVAVPFLFARNVRDIVAIAQSPSMAPWRLGNDYDRPIPRRILETAGLARNLFGQRKQVVMHYYNRPVNPELCRSFMGWLTQHFRLAGSRFQAYEVLARIEWQAGHLAGWLERVLGVALEPPPIKRWAFRGHDVRYLMFMWAATQLSSELADSVGPDLRGLTSRAAVSR